MKTILFLGAAHFQMPPIEYAVKQGFYAITLDNKPDNPGHAIAHKSYKQISTLDKEKVLAVAEKEKIDGIVSFASDVSMSTAAYVANCMDLQGSSTKTIDLLINKIKFRSFLLKKGFQSHFFTAITPENQTTKIPEIADNQQFPLIVKPTDRSGSRGISIVENGKELEEAVNKSLAVSIKKEVIIETYFEKEGRQICGDGYMEDGKLRFIAYGDGYFYKHTQCLAPYAETFPSKQPKAILDKVSQHLEQILQEVAYLDGPFNFDVLIKKNGDVFVIEIGPRCGGNFLPLLIQLNHGVNLIAASVNLAINKAYKLPEQTKVKENLFWAGYMIHAKKKGVLKEIRFDPTLKPYLYCLHAFMKIGMPYKAFTQGNHAIGNVILKFEDRTTMESIMKQIQELIVIY